MSLIRFIDLLLETLCRYIRFPQKKNYVVNYPVDILMNAVHTYVFDYI